MTTLIKNSPEETNKVTLDPPGTLRPDPRPKSMQGSRAALLRALGVLAIFGLALGLSVKSDYLFFKELLLAGSIFGMAMLMRAAQHPAIIISREGPGKAHLN